MDGFVATLGEQCAQESGSCIAMAGILCWGIVFATLCFDVGQCMWKGGDLSRDKGSKATTEQEPHVKPLDMSSIPGIQVQDEFHGFSSFASSAATFCDEEGGVAHSWSIREETPRPWAKNEHGIIDMELPGMEIDGHPGQYAADAAVQTLHSTFEELSYIGDSEMGEKYENWVLDLRGYHYGSDDIIDPDVERRVLWQLANYHLVALAKTYLESKGKKEDDPLARDEALTNPALHKDARLLAKRAYDTVAHRGIGLLQRLVYWYSKQTQYMWTADVLEWKKAHLHDWDNQVKAWSVVGRLQTEAKKRLNEGSASASSKTSNKVESAEGPTSWQGFQTRSAASSSWQQQPWKKSGDWQRERRAKTGKLLSLLRYGGSNHDFPIEHFEAVPGITNWGDINAVATALQWEPQHILDEVFTKPDDKVQRFAAYTNGKELWIGVYASDYGKELGRRDAPLRLWGTNPVGYWYDGKKQHEFDDPQEFMVHAPTPNKLAYGKGKRWGGFGLQLPEAKRARSSCGNSEAGSEEADCKDKKQESTGPPKATSDDKAEVAMPGQALSKTAENGGEAPKSPERGEPAKEEAVKSPVRALEKPKKKNDATKQVKQVAIKKEGNKKDKDRAKYKSKKAKKAKKRPSTSRSSSEGRRRQSSS
jgi:hypothetical protein